MYRLYGTSAILRLGGLLAILSLPGAITAGRLNDDAVVARAQLQTARPLVLEASEIVSIKTIGLRQADPREKLTRTQDFIVEGRITGCYKGSLKPSAIIVYRLTAEGRPVALLRDHIAFLRRHGSSWSSLDGPVFRDSSFMRTGLKRITKGCSR